MKINRQVIALFLLAAALFLYSRSDKSDNDQINDAGIATKAVVPVWENRVHRAGMLWMNVTNTGYFGNPDVLDDPCTGSTAVSGELPGGTGTDYLSVGALMFGGYLDSITVSINTTQAILFQGPLVTTAYEGWSGLAGYDDMPRECWPANFDEDINGTILGHIKESSSVEGRISCLFEDVYDPLATAEEQFNLMFTDKFVQRMPYTGMDEYDKRNHIPLGIEVRQKSYAWSYDYAKKFVIIDYTIYNRNTENKDIYDFFTGLYLDCDIGMTGGMWTYDHGDDIGGFIQKWDGYIDPSTGERKTLDMNLAWAADNDGRNYTGTGFYTATGEPGAGAPLDGATSIATVRVLRNPNPNLRYSFNQYRAGTGDEALDWGPRWQTGLHADWQYDLTTVQKGYDDYNQDSLTNGGVTMYGGRTEGRPAGDKGKYMVMSNDEFDYEHYRLRELYLGLLQDPDYMQGTPYAQAEKWQNWNGDVLQQDGTIAQLNDLANGSDVKSLLSFGPLGTETSVNAAVDTNLDGVVDDYTNKKVWKFAYGDSLKLTIAFMVSENFNTSLDQDPNYDNPDIVGLSDGLDPELYNRGWYDALRNSVWVDRMYDIPMYDTPVSIYGETKGDGWYGEDVGKDALFGDVSSDSQCWWLDTEYSGPDTGEGDLELSIFTNTITDVYGHSASNEDELLPLGREIESAAGLYGTTAEYGYMVKYNNPDGFYPQGTWVRYGFDNGRLDAGDGVPDFKGPPPPPSPKIDVSFEGNDVVVMWQSHEFYTTTGGFENYTGAEQYLDPFTRIKDFEGYTVKVSPNSISSNFVDVLTIDKVDFIYENVANMGEYYDIPIVTGSPDTLDLTIVGNGKIWELRPYGNNSSLLADHSLNEIYSYTVEPASRVIQVAAGVNETVNYYKYKFILIDKYLESEFYLSVVSSDFGDPKMGVPALTSNIIDNMKKVSPAGIDENVIPAVTELFQNYPNPFNPDTKILFSVAQKCNVELTLYNVVGQQVKHILNNEFKAGYHTVTLKADELNSGVYYYTLKTNDKKITRKMLLIK